MDYNYRELLEKQRQNKEQRAKKYEEDSKDRLLKIGSKQIRTTMIGALAAIEKVFGPLWNHGGSPRNEVEAAYREAYEQLRKDILDKGNQQIHNFTQELSQYQVVWKRYSLTLPVVHGTALPKD